MALSMLVLAGLACSSAATTVDEQSTKEARLSNSATMEAELTAAALTTEKSTKPTKGPTEESVITLTKTPIALPTLKPSETPVLIKPVGYGTVTINANLRTGPGTDNQVIGVAAIGESLPIFARTSDGWFLVDGQVNKWIGSTLVEVDVTLSAIPVAEDVTKIPVGNESDGISSAAAEKVTNPTATVELTVAPTPTPPPASCAEANPEFMTAIDNSVDRLDEIMGGLSTTRLDLSQIRATGQKLVAHWEEVSALDYPACANMFMRQYHSYLKFSIDTFNDILSYKILPANYDQRVEAERYLFVIEYARLFKVED